MNYDPGRYILVGHEAVPEPDLLKWGQWLEHAERHVRLTRVGPYEVSTVFLGLDHNHMRHLGRTRPVLFETMVFMPEMQTEVRLGGRSLGKHPESLDIQERCSTWLEAEAQHERVVEQVREPGDEVLQIWPIEISGSGMISGARSSF